MADLAVLLAKKFIQRRDVKAKQLSNGEYMPHTHDNKRTGNRLPWKMHDLEAHLSGEATYGHYMLDTESHCRLFAFDIDLEQVGYLPSTFDEDGVATDFHSCDPRDAWRDRRHPARGWMKVQFRMIAETLAGIASKDLDMPVAVAYSGCKGVHVYCFHEPMSAVDSRDGAQLVLDTSGVFDLMKGKNFYKHKDSDPEMGYPNLSIEVFPKQTDLTDKDLGNLMRMPLGRNLKTPDPTFFVDLTAPFNEMRPGDAESILVSGNPWLTV